MTGDSTLPMVSTPAEARALVRAITTDHNLQELVRLFRAEPSGWPRIINHLFITGGRLPQTEQTHAARILQSWCEVRDELEPPQAYPDDAGRAVEWLREFASARWDFRCGQERDYIPTSQELLPADVAELVYTIADSWGMRSPRVAQGDFDAVIVLGGLVRANLNRPQAAADLLNSGSVRSPLVVGLAGDRTTSVQEAKLAEALGVPADTERHALAYGMSRSFGVATDSWQVEDDGEGRTSLRFRRGDGLELLVVSAPPLEPGRRATSASAFEWFARSSGLVGSTSRLLSLTTPIYWIQNHIDLLQRLQHSESGAVLVTAGGAAEVVPEQWRQPYRSQHYLQEIKSALDALPRLLAWADNA